MSRLCQVISNAMLLAAFALSPSLVVAQAMILHLPLDAVDESGAFTVTSDGVAGPQPVAGKNGQAMHFQGKSALGIPFDFNFRKYPQVTVTAWVKQDVGASNSRAILSSASPKGLMLSVNGGRAVLVPGTGGLSYPAPMPFNEWVFIAGVVDMNTGRASLYQDDGDAVVKDGIVMINDDASKFGDPNDANAPKQPFLVVGAGKFSPWLTVERSMAIDDVRLYASALTREQIDAIRNNSASVQTTTPENIGETEKNDPGANESVTIGTPSTPKMPYDTSTPTTPMGGTSGPTGSSVTAPIGTAVIPSGADQIGKSADEALPDAPRPAVTVGMGEKVEMPGAGDTIAQSQNDALPEGNTPPSEAVDGTVTRQQSLEPAGSNGKPHPVGEAKFSAISGYAGDLQQTVDMKTEFLRMILWQESSNKPCFMSLNDYEQTYRKRYNRETLFIFEKCGNGIVGGVRRINFDNGNVIGRIEVCSTSNKNRALKGIKAYADVLRPDGSTTYIPQAKTATRANCSEWHQAVLCPNDTLATGMVFHADKNADQNRWYIVGLQLVCHEVSVQ